MRAEKTVGVLVVSKAALKGLQQVETKDEPRVAKMVQQLVEKKVYSMGQIQVALKVVRKEKTMVD